MANLKHIFINKVTVSVYILQFLPRCVYRINIPACVGRELLGECCGKFMDNLRHLQLAIYIAAAKDLYY